MTSKTLSFALLSLALSGMTSQAQSAATSAGKAAAPAPLSPIEQSIKDLKHPVDWLTWGTDLRIRNEYFDDLLTLSPKNKKHEQDYFRVRARLWASITPIEDLSLNARLATEPREWMRPNGYTSYRTPLDKGHTGLDMTEGVVDNLNVEWRNILGQPAKLIVGRQDIMIGEGWLTGDGTPYDGSWTYFLDAARLSYELKDQHTVIETIGIVQNAKDDGTLPTINNQNRFLTEQNEKGMILNIVNTSLPYANFNPYFIYKQDQRAMGNSANPTPPGGDNADIFTLGGRVSGLIRDHWKYSVEGAYQFGHKQDGAINDSAAAANAAVKKDYRSISAFGFNSKASYLFKDSLNNQVSLSYEYLSGDDRNSHSDEMFDVLWGRYPRWSEIGLYCFAAETRIGQQANMHRIGPSWSLTPVKDLDFSANYYVLLADQDVATRGAAGLFTGTGNFRGHFAAAMLKYKFSRHMNGHLWSEFLFPGDYYANRRMISFLRAEVMFTL